MIQKWKAFLIFSGIDSFRLGKVLVGVTPRYDGGFQVLQKLAPVLGRGSQDTCFASRLSCSFDQHLYRFLGLAPSWTLGLRNVLSSLIPGSQLLRLPDILLNLWPGLTCV